MDPAHSEPRAASNRLGLWDATSIIVGIIVGVGIFEVPAKVFARVTGPWEALGLWALGGLLAFVGALCFAELASTYPRSGGEYVYLRRAYGPWMGFLFGWAQLTVFRTGSIAALAYVFARHVCDLWNLPNAWLIPLAALSIFVLTGVNLLGVRLGKGAQNLLTLVKVLGVSGLVVAGLLVASPAAPSVPGAPVTWIGFAAAMTYILWTYSGWHEAAYVAAEVREQRRNLPRALMLGALIVSAIYVLVNAALIVGLGSGRVAADGSSRILALALGEVGDRAFHLLVLLSALGAMNGMILTSARIFAELGVDHRLFAPLKEWSPRFGTPLRSLIVQGGISIALVVGVGLWWQSTEGFDALVEATAGVFWLFFFLTGIALFILRFTDPTRDRPFKVPGYPVVPLLFCGWCAYMVIGVIGFAPERSLLGLALVALGLPLYFISEKSLFVRPRVVRPAVPLAPHPECRPLGRYASK